MAPRAVAQCTAVHHGARPPPLLLTMPYTCTAPSRRAATMWSDRTARDTTGVPGGRGDGLLQALACRRLSDGCAGVA